MNGSSESCANCRFYRKDQAGTWCHRFPPTGYPVPDTLRGMMLIGQWAPTPPHEWCGEWKADKPGGGVVSAMPFVKPDEPPQGGGETVA